MWAQGFAGQPSNGGFDDRLQQSIRYDTPSYVGLPASRRNSRPRRHERPDQRELPSSNTNAQSYGLFYRNGPFVVGTAYEYHHNQRGTAQLPLSDWAFSVAAKWQFSGFNIAGVYEKMEYEVANGLADRYQVRNKLKRNSFWALDTTINVGANGQVFLFCGQGVATARAARSTRRNRSSRRTPSSTSQISRVAGLAKGDNTGATQWEVSYSYDLSQRTRVYAGYVKINNDSNASYNFNINAYPGSAATGWPAGMKPGGFVMGMYHNF